MTWIDRRRRAASVLLILGAAVLALLAVPAVANATFAANRTSGLVASTDRMETPSGITGTYQCSRHGNTESISLTVTRFTDAGPAGSSYGYGLALGSSIEDTAYGTSTSATLAASRRNDGASTTWTVGIQSYLNRWTSDIGTESIVCPASGTGSGTF